jgi:hypothetical protein
MRVRFVQDVRAANATGFVSHATNRCLETIAHDSIGGTMYLLDKQRNARPPINRPGGSGNVLYLARSVFD